MKRLLNYDDVIGGIRESCRIVEECAFVVNDIMSSRRLKVLLPGGWPIDRPRNPNKMTGYMYAPDEIRQGSFI